MYTRRLEGDIQAALSAVSSSIFPITNAERDLFFQFMDKDTQDFSNNWFYTLQATAFGRYAYHDNGTLLAFTVYRPDTIPWAFVQYLGKNAIKHAFELGQKLMQVFEVPIIFKNLTSEQYEELLSYGCEDYRASDGWNTFYRYDDDTFPETITDVNSLCSLKGRAYHSIRYRIHQFQKNNVKVRQYTPDLYSDAQLVLEKWLKMIKKRYEKYLENDPIILHSASIHQDFLDYINQSNDSFFTSQLIYLDDVPVSFTIGYRLSKSTLGVYTTIAATDSIKGLSESTIFYLAKTAQEQGYAYLNLGGSEFQSLLNFKKKFHPTRTISKKHAVLYPE